MSRRRVCPLLPSPGQQPPVPWKEVRLPVSGLLNEACLTVWNGLLLATCPSLAAVAVLPFDCFRGHEFLLLGLRLLRDSFPYAGVNAVVSRKEVRWWSPSRVAAWALNVVLLSPPAAALLETHAVSGHLLLYGTFVLSGVCRASLFKLCALAS